jgi:hypothetical protein
MKRGILAIALLAGLAACNRAPTNNVVANQTAGMPIPPERPATPVVPVQAGQQNAMPPGLDCVRNRLTPDQRRDAAAVAMEQGTRDDPRAQALLRAVDACGEELSWSPRKRNLASTFSISAAGAAGIRQALDSRGIPIEELDPTILADRELMAAAESGRLDGTVGEAFAARHLDELQRIAGGADALAGEVGVRIGNYLAFRALAEILARRFAAEP